MQHRDVKSLVGRGQRRLIDLVIETFFAGTGGRRCRRGRA
ncbi:hypothetical protein I553_2543 [Mycobacterium xenopi 4042]|uniref:Uncharacterized protein n=1 Tax=Mycobacterium xenopi 4042 TaxID=1299334 RepID=X8C9A2_MYCXE|nr:hypothetical protein I553_2543 [Mycobacterium xenopi 4042]